MVSVKPISIDMLKNTHGRIYIYGGEVYGRIVFYNLNRFGIGVEAILDRHADTINNAWENKCKIISPDYVKFQDSDLILVCASRGFNGICDGLEQKGVRTVYEVSSILDLFDKNAESSDWDLFSNSNMIDKYLFFVQKYRDQTDAIIVPEMGVVTTEYCSLKCKYCAQRNPYLKNKKVFAVEEIVKSMDILLNCVSGINRVSLVGGEVFLYKNLPILLSELSQRKQIHELIVLTNGDVFPSEAMWEAMRDNDIRLHIEDYGINSSRKDEIEEECGKRGIEVRIMHQYQWFDLSVFCDMKESEEELNLKFRDCSMAGCYTLYGRYLSVCGYAMAVYRQGLLDHNDGMIDMLGNTSEEEIKKLFLRKDHLEACKYCLGTKDNTVEVAKQL